MDLVSTIIDFNTVNDCLEKFDDAVELDDLLHIFQCQIESFGFQRFTYWVIWPPKGKRKPLYISSFREDYSRHYIENDFKNIDAAWKHTKKTTLPFSWSEIVKDKTIPKSYKIIFDQSRDFGMASGGTLPIYGPGRTRAAISIACSTEQDNFDDQFQRFQHILHIMGSYMHERIIKLVYFTDDKENTEKITPRELEILLWTSRGKTKWEIGEILSISENTVRNHVQNICQKYDVTNKTHAVAIAIMNGDILP